jgi:hypothetical protein
MHRRLVLAAVLALPLALPAAAEAPPGCVACHERLHPSLVSDWSISRHARALVGCEACHGTAHGTVDDVALVAMPSPDTCGRCHSLQVAQFKRSKHARAWAAVKALPTFHHLAAGGPGEITGCAACHRIGLKTEAEGAALLQAGVRHGQASCDACHTRHSFSKLEARQPEACRTCHGDLQYDAWAASKHGTRHTLQVSGRLPDAAAAPTCQVCHLQNGDHANRTPWGNLGLRLPLPQDEAWARDVKDIMVALGVLDALGGEGPRALDVERAGLFFLDRIDYQNERHKLTQACKQCHGASFVREQLDARDALVRYADALCAQAVREVQALHADGLLPRRPGGPALDLVSAALGPPVERQLATMIFDHRAKLMATAFHMSPEVATWRATLAQDLLEIERQADAVRPAAAPAKAGAKPAAAGAAKGAAKR